MPKFGKFKTYTGIDFDLDDPQPEMVDIRDIAHALANIPRYLGHTTSHYSVAHHALLVSKCCQPHNSLRGLMHDGAEAYIGDWPPQIKQALPDLVELEARVQSVVNAKFGIKTDVIGDAEVARWDKNEVLAAECRDLHPHLKIAAEPMLDTVRPWILLHVAEVSFLRRFVQFQRTLDREEAGALRLYTESIHNQYLNRESFERSTP